MREQIIVAIFIWLGAFYLLPFNIIINLFDYSKAKLGEEFNPNIFSACQDVVFQLLSLIINIISLTIGNTPPMCCLILPIVCTVLLLGSHFIISAIQWINGWGYFLAALFLAGSLSTVQAVFDNVCYSYTQLFGRKILRGYMCGVNASGTILACIYVFLNLTTYTVYTKALVYFLSAACIALITLIPASLLRLPIIVGEEPQIARPEVYSGYIWSYKRVAELMKKIRLPFLLQLANFTATLLIYPHFMIRSGGGDGKQVLIGVPEVMKKNSFLFNAVYIFLLFNISALMGNIGAYFKPTRNYFILCFLLCLRISICIYFILFQQGTFDTNIYFTNIYVFTVSLTVFAFYSAYLCTCSFNLAIHLVNQSNAVSAIKLINIALSIGLLTGSITAQLYLWVLK